MEKNNRATGSTAQDRRALGRRDFMDHLNENLGAINVQLTPADVSELETAFSKLKVHGGRMNEMQMQVVDRTA